MASGPAAADDEEIAQPRAGDEQHGRAGHAEHDGGAEVGLGEQQRRRRRRRTASGLKKPCAELRSSVWWRTAKIAM